MTGLLEFRDKLKSIYSHNEVFILPVVKFLVALLTLGLINSHMGYMTKLDNLAIVLIVALMCSFLPKGAIVLFAAVFTLLHMYSLSIEVALVGLVVYLLLFLLFLRFSPKDSLAVVITPLLCVMQIPYVVPVAMGLLGTPVSAITVSCGVIVYYLLVTITGNATAISTMGEEEAIAKIRMIVDGLLDNKSMLVVIASFAITVIVVYLIRRMSIDYSWTIAIVAGAMINLIVMLVGDLIYDTNVSILNAVVGSVVAIAVAKVIEFFRFCVDYSRTEKVQFEDDEYYYYVKAVPKMTVAAQTKTVKRINTQTRGDYYGRSVTTERTGRSRNYQEPRGYNKGREHLNGGRSMTISSEQMTDDVQDDYEEIF
ncbi:MAG: hypothetical protein J6A94_02795 [Lachnospiraceae bacterium]|nr:hypothetical protein [Lachnospiraceae bacterium]